MIKRHILSSLVVIFLFLPLTFIGCSGGGDDAPAPSPSPLIQVLPSNYNFGTVTPGNSPAPLEVEIANNGSAELTVSAITLSDIINFALLSGRSDPCDTPPMTIAAGNKCTVEVEIQPKSTNSFNEMLTITSNDPNTSTYDLDLIGRQDAAVSLLNVKINQVEANCPGTEFTAYVSVTDQGGFSVTTLTKDDFSITEAGAGGYVGPPDSKGYASEITETISVALVMDYSGSITNVQDNVDDMEAAVAGFIDEMEEDDEAEIIKFDKEFEVVQTFTSDNTLLTEAIFAPYDMGPGTRLYDAVVKAVDNTALRLKNRKAVIVITDGVDDDGSGNPLSDNDLNDAINYANDNGVPIFTVGLGQLLDKGILEQMADDTGGQFYEAITSDNLRTIYQQLADVLFYDQYILTYTSGLGANVTADLTIEATFSPTKKRSDKKAITTCQ